MPLKGVSKMVEQKTFEQLVKEKFNGLSAAQKKVAEYLINHLEKAALSTAVQIAREAEVSETTVVRLSYALGFSGFSEMLEQIQKQFLLVSNVIPQVANTEEIALSGEANLFSSVLKSDIANLQHMLVHMNQEELWRAVDAFIQADHVLVIGHRGSYAAANWFTFILGIMRSNVYLCPSGGEPYESLFQLTDCSAALVISFPRYSRESVELAVTAKTQGAKLISITDRPLSPVGRISDITLTTGLNVDEEMGFSSMSAVISLLHLLALGVMSRDRNRVQSRQHRLEQLYTKLGAYIE